MRFGTVRTLGAVGTTIGTVLTVLIVGGVVSKGATAAQNGTVDRTVRQGIQQTWDDFITALRQKNAAAIARAWAVDGDHGGLVPDANLKSGRADIEAMWVEGLPGLPSRERYVKLRAVRLLRPDVALVDGTVESGPSTAADGTRAPAGREPFFAVMTRDGARWVISATRMGASVRDPQ